MHAKEWQLYNDRGEPKYLSHAEYRRFQAFTARLAVERRAFARLLGYTGCRLSEAISLTRTGILDGGVVLRTLKRRKPIYRWIPVPDELIADLNAVPINEKCAERVFFINRSTGYRWIAGIMRAPAVQVDRSHASPRGLRHAFGLRASAQGLPQGVTQSVFGHASPSTTTIYLNLKGEDLRALVSRTWR